MASTSEIAHRWANMDFGKHGTLTGSSTHCDTISFYSYGTVIAQWLDKEKKLMVVSDGSSSVTTERHIADVLRAVPGDVTLLLYHTRDWTGWDGTRVLSEYDPKFTAKERRIMIQNMVREMRDKYRTWANTNGCGKYSFKFEGASTVQQYWKQINLLQEIYKDCAVKTVTKDMDKDMRTLVWALQNKKSDEEIMRLLFGEEIYQNWYKKTQPTRTRAINQEKYVRLVQYLNPEQYMYRSFMKEYSYSKLKKMSGLEIFNLKMRILESMKSKASVAYDRKVNQIQKFLGQGIKPHISKYWSGKPFNKSHVFKNHRNGYLPQSMTMGNVVEDFCASKDKVEYRKHLLRACWYQYLYELGGTIHTHVKFGGLNINMFDDTEQQAYRFYVKRTKLSQDRWQRRENARKEKERVEYERRMALKQYYESLGVEGIRKAWREEGLKIGCWNKTKEIFRGGNVLLRLNQNYTKIETSLGINFNVDVAIRFFKIIQEWHENPLSFLSKEFRTNCGTYRITSYENDILTAGCHKIAYCEMKEMYDEIMKYKCEVGHVEPAVV